MMSSSGSVPSSENINHSSQASRCTACRKDEASDILTHSPSTHILFFFAQKDGLISLSETQPWYLCRNIERLCPTSTKFLTLWLFWGKIGSFLTRWKMFVPLFCRSLWMRHRSLTVVTGIIFRFYAADSERASGYQPTATDMRFDSRNKIECGIKQELKIFSLLLLVPFSINAFRHEPACDGNPFTWEAARQGRDLVYWFKI